jgi:3-methyladenine DNA glycosylase/8-oxoguanine DNA glycosylase
VAVTRRTLAEAATTLAARDPVLATLVRRHGTPPARPHVPAGLRFATLANAILYQQLAGRAAAAIHGRFVAALGGEVTPATVLATPPEVLASCGLSRAKAAAITDLAAKVASGEVALDRIGRLDDEAVVEHLVRVRGIGRWTAEMFLISTLGRLDVWPVGDYGVRAGYGRGWGLGGTPTPAELDGLGERYRPYRSVVAWYCWRVMDERDGG